jgi:hypothetical protein
MLTHLINPKGETYQSLKSLVTGQDFSWNYEFKSTPDSDDSNEEYENVSFYSHVFLRRPDSPYSLRYPEIKSRYHHMVHDALIDIFNINELTLNCFYRINANCVHPTQLNKLTHPHVDHKFPHTNVLLYLNDAGGETIVWDERTGFQSRFYPKEDDIIIFQGQHCHRPPQSKRRIVIVATYM